MSRDGNLFFVSKLTFFVSLYINFFAFCEIFILMKIIIIIKSFWFIISLNILEYGKKISDSREAFKSKNLEWLKITQILLPIPIYDEPRGLRG